MVAETQPVETFPYRPQPQTGLGVAARLAAIVGLALLAVLLAAIALLYLLGSPTRAHISVLPFVVVIGLALAYMGVGLFSQVIVITSDIALDGDGVTLHLARWWQVRVPWDKLGSAMLFERAAGSDYRAPGLVGEHFALVQVRGLTLLHALAAAQFGAGIAPLFVVTAYHEGGERLVETLRARAGVVL